MPAAVTGSESEKAEFETLPNDSKNTESNGMITRRAREEERSILMGFVIFLYCGEMLLSRERSRERRELELGSN